MRLPTIHVERPPGIEDEADPKGIPVVLRYVADGLLLTKHAVSAWYRLPGARYLWLTQQEQQQVLAQVALATIGLTEVPIHLRVTQRVYGPEEWARRFTDANRAQGLVPPDPAGYADRLMATQEHIRYQMHADTECYLGVEFAARSKVERVARRLRLGKVVDREMARLKRRVDEIDQIMARPGLAGRRCTNEETGWLLHRSYGLGLPEVRHPGTAAYEPADLFGITDGVERFQSTRHRAVRMVGHRDGARFERWAVVMSIGRMEKLDTPGVTTPWVAHAQALDFPVEWSIRYWVDPRDKALVRIGNRLGIFTEQIEQWQALGKDIPDDLGEVTRDAKARRKEILSGDPVVAAHCTWTARAAVFGDTEKEALARAHAFTAHYRGIADTPQPVGQRDLTLEFMPGEKQATVAHTRYSKIPYLVAGLPTMTTRLGDGDGIYLGSTTGIVRRPVHLNPYAMVRSERSGFTPIIGDQGCGKSTLLYRLGYQCADMGMDATLLTGGRDAAKRIANLPERRDDTLVFNVLDESRNGFLSPYWVVAEPRRDRFYDDDDVRALPAGDRDGLVDDMWAEAKEAAQATRRELAADVLKMMLDPGLFTAKARALITTAASRAPSSQVATLQGVLDALRQSGDLGVQVADHFQALARMRVPAKFFGAGRWSDYNALAEPRLLIISLAGVDLPDEKTPPEAWTSQQRQHVPVLHLALHLMSRRIYSQPMLLPKFAGADELGLLGPWTSGKGFLNGLSRNSRKWRLMFAAASQDPADILGLDVSALVGNAFIGTTTDPGVAARALPLVGVKPERRFTDRLAALSPLNPDGTAPGYREFLARIGAGTDTMTVDLGDNPGLLAALTPGAPMPGDAEWAA